MGPRGTWTGDGPLRSFWDPILCDPMNCSTLGLPVHHQLPEFRWGTQGASCVVLGKSVFLLVGFRKGRGPRDQIANIRWIIKKAREFQKNIY